MKRLKNINLPTTLQITAILVIFLFGYPGCLSNRQSKGKIVNTAIPATSPVFSSTLK